MRHPLVSAKISLISKERPSIKLSCINSIAIPYPTSISIITITPFFLIGGKAAASQIYKLVEREKKIML